MEQSLAPLLLIAEDHPPTASVLSRLVLARGFNVLTATSLAEARRLAETRNIGFLITDLDLPDGNGWELMAELHEQIGINGAAVSGLGQPADLERSRSAGFIMHLVKPISVHQLDSLLQMVRREFDSPGATFPGLPGSG